MYKLAAALIRICTGDFKREIELLEEQYAACMKQITGRQLYWLILKELAKKRSDDTVNDLEDLLEVNLRADPNLTFGAPPAFAGLRLSLAVAGSSPLTIICVRSACATFAPVSSGAFSDWNRTRGTTIPAVFKREN